MSPGARLASNAQVQSGFVEKGCSLYIVRAAGGISLWMFHRVLLRLRLEWVNGSQD